MRHLTDADMRRAVDDPSTLDMRRREHLRACSRCSEILLEVRENARFAAGLFAAPAPAVDTRRAFQSMQARLAAEGHTARPWTARIGAWLRFRGRGMTAGLTGAAAGVVVIGSLALTPAGSLAQSFVDIFQPQDVATVSVTTADLHSMLQLRHYGTVHPPRNVSNQSVSGVAEAAGTSGMHVMTPSTLPADISHTASYTVVPGTTGSFTFSAAKAQTWASKHGKTLAAMPRGLDGSTLTITTGNAVLATYKGSDGSLPGLVVGQMQAPHVSTTGVSVRTMESYVLNLPGVPRPLATEIEALGDPTRSLILPVPVDFASAHEVQVHGVKGYAIGDNTGLGSVVIWEQNAVIYGVGGTMAESQAIQVADSLQ